MNDILQPQLSFENFRLKGPSIEKITRTIGDLKHIYADQDAYDALAKDEVVYEVESDFPVQDGTEGGLFMGITYIYPGKVGNEYFMTKGHFHKIRNRGEVYFGMQGKGMLIFMDQNRKTWAEKMYPGSIHYIPGYTAHRTANTGSSVLSFGAFWPSDAGHDYDTIVQQGFSKILVDRHGEPTLIENIR